MEQIITLKNGKEIKALLTSRMFACDNDGNIYGKEIYLNKNDERIMTDYYTFRSSDFNLNIAKKKSKEYQQRILAGNE